MAPDEATLLQAVIDDPDDERRHGRREWLHPTQRRGRQVFREEI
jgi:hypothetical protein